MAIRWRPDAMEPCRRQSDIQSDVVASTSSSATLLKSSSGFSSHRLERYRAVLLPTIANRNRHVRPDQTGAGIRDWALLPTSAIRHRRAPADTLSWPVAGLPGHLRTSSATDLLGQSGIDEKPTRTGDRPSPSDEIGISTSTVARLDIRHEFAEYPAKSSQGVSQASLVAILHAPKTVHTTSQAAITATAMAVDSGSKYDESRSPAGPFTIP